VSETHTNYVKHNIDKFIRQSNITTEIKWNKTKKGNFAKHRALANFFFECIDREIISFHVIFVDFQRFDHKLKEGGNKDESLKRMYSQLIIHRFGKHFGKENNLYVFPDKAKELSGLEDMKERLNDKLDRDYDIKSNPIKCIEFRDSEKSVFLQFNDIILGGLCYQRNNRHDEEGVGRYKAALSGYIHGRSGINNLEGNTPKSNMKFSVWNFSSDKLKGGH